ncbi:MAG: DEAD/DEAH box helicase [Candidatus Pacebacteria bacterium]|nr:DEAD/DEAH box helicase [Candidatus Paceibacterota bacterium]
METKTFNELGIKPEILEILNKLKFTIPSPIQSQAIPVAIEGNDVIGIAQTGTGKTLAFGVPTIQKLMTSQGTALIILPTRELALQVDEALSKIGRFFNLRSAVLIGGQNMNKQLRDLKTNPRIIVSTPGRLIDHLERKTVRLDNVKILVLDEADRMLDMGFAPQIKRILQEVPAERQTMLFSATMPAEIVSIANRYMKTPLRVEVAPAGSAADNVTHEIFFVKEGSKLALLESIVKERKGSILVFSRTKHGAKRIAFALRKMTFTSTEIHSNRTLAQRVAALEGFKKGRYQVMVATDIAARGIDVKGIEVVVNYDLPDSPEDYVHRIGRTGRAEELGHAISFATPRQLHDIRIIERLIKKQLPVSPLPELLKLDASIMEGMPERGERRDHGEGGRSFRGESRGRSASGSRYGSRTASSQTDSRRSERPSEDRNSRGQKDRRGFLPKRTPQRASESKDSRVVATAASKGKDFYAEFPEKSFFKTDDYQKSDRIGAKQSSDRQPARPQSQRGRNDYQKKESFVPNRAKAVSSSSQDEYMTPDEVHSTFNSHKRKGGMRPSFAGRSGGQRSSGYSNNRSNTGSSSRQTSSR